MRISILILVFLVISVKSVLAGGEGGVRLVGLSQKDSSEVSPKDLVFAAFDEVLKELRSLPMTETIQSETWRHSAVHRLLDFDQFGAIPQEKFRMGRSTAFGSSYGDEYWVDLKKEVQITLQRVPVTQLLFYLITGTNPSHFKSPKDCDNFIQVDGTSLCPFNPVEHVSWNQITEKSPEGDFKEGTFFHTLRVKFGIEGRLPTDAEFEKAYRGHVKDPHFNHPLYIGGLGETKDYGDSSWVDELNAIAWTKYNAEGKTHPVGVKSWNSLGLADLCGNVRHWIEDYYLDWYPQNTADSPALNPRQLEPQKLCSDYKDTHVLRGGSFQSWTQTEAYFATERGRGDAFSEMEDTGFRIVREIPKWQ